jgi:diacylglycerol kinase family enzyme
VGDGGIFRERACLGIISPGNLPYLESYSSLLAEHFARLTVVLPESIEHLQSIIAQAAERHDLVMAIGGDGTINQVVQKMDLAEQTLIVVPSGRGNDFARALNLPRRLEAYLGAFPELTVHEIDIWTAGERRFVNSLGIGLDTEVLKTMAKAKGALRASYMAAFLATLPKLRPISLQAVSGGLAITSGIIWWIVCMNSTNIGGGIPVTPSADLNDGKLDVLVVENCSKWEMLTKLPKLYMKKHLGDRHIRLIQTAELDFAGWQTPLGVGFDGDLAFISSDSLEIRHAGKLKVACRAEDKS